MAFKMQMTIGRAFGAPLKFAHMTKCFAAYAIAIFLVNNVTTRTHLHTLVLGGMTSVAMIT